MKSYNFCYLMGRLLGFILIFGLYAVGGWAFILDVLNKEIPIVPIMFILIISIWRMLIKFSVFVEINKALGENLEIVNLLMDVQKNSDIDLNKIMNKINNKSFGGPN